MTLVSQIITDAYRESNIIPLGASPNTNQDAEALRRLNVIVLSTIGNEAGDELIDINIGGEFDQADMFPDFVPENARLVLNLEEATELNLHPHPYDGMRLALIDVGSNLATYNLTLNGNGRNIEGASTLVLSTDDVSFQWMYRADLGNWVLLTELETSDELPFPLEFDDYFVTYLATRLNPKYGQILPPESYAALQRMRSQIRARYRVRPQLEFDFLQTIHPDWYGNRYSNDRSFQLGSFYPWR